MKITFSLLFIGFLITARTSAQTSFYNSTGGEMIFSFATIEDNGRDESGVIRWSPWFNLQSMFNADFNKNIGSFIGIGVRNVGFIYDSYRVVDLTDKDNYTTVKKKFRSYNVGVPVGLKIGNLKKFFIYGGYEIELPVNYKEKTFEGDHKTDKFNVWFSKRQEQFQQSFMVGIQFPYGGNLKFKYYLTNFFNKDFVDVKDGISYKPYEGIDANVFFFFFTYNMFKNTKQYHKRPKETKEYY